LELNFKNEEYKKQAMQDAKRKYSSERSEKDAFFKLINKVSKEDLSNLCKLIQSYFKLQEPSIELDLDEAYKLTQGENIESVEKNFSNENVKAVIYNLAYICLENGKPLGNKTIANGTINTSDWMGHSLFEGKLAGELAGKLGLDVVRAQKLGILHDYGRKITHNFEHVTRGYEALVDDGWNAEAIGCLTHSFLAGRKMLL
jgi:putative nucleotidyltransferase with HDIG domain